MVNSTRGSKKCMVENEDWSFINDLWILPNKDYAQSGFNQICNWMNYKFYVELEFSVILGYAQLCPYCRLQLPNQKFRNDPMRWG